MIIVENTATMHQFEGESLDFLIDDSTQIGEVFLDGNLIFQADDVIDEEQLENEFFSEYAIIRNDEEWDVELEDDFNEIDNWEQHIYNKQGEVMTSNELYDTMETQWNEFQENHSKFVEKGNRAAATRARKAIGELKKLVTEYRKQSVSESKKA